MAKVTEWVRNLLAIAGLLALGYWLGSSSHVQAASYSGSDVEFQLTGVNETSSLLVYQPGTKTVPPSSNGPRPVMPTTPPQVRLPIKGPRPAWRNM